MSIRHLVAAALMASACAAHAGIISASSDQGAAHAAADLHANGGANANANGLNHRLGNQAAGASAVPEPSSIALIMAGVLVVAGLGRRRGR